MTDATITATAAAGGRRKRLGVDVKRAAVERLGELYRAGNRVVLSFSGGKDSGVCLELMIEAARAEGKLPVEVCMRDDEVAYPGVIEYAMRTRARPEVDFHWIVMRQPVVNVFCREAPYFWAYDPLLKPEEWMQPMPEFTEEVHHNNIEALTTPDRFPPAPGKELFAVIGLRVQESLQRMMGLFSSGGHLTKANSRGVRCCRPIYDWSDGDVWKAVLDNGWDYNRDYDVFRQLGINRRNLRIGPPTLVMAGVDQLGAAARAWPRWFDRVCRRLKGARQAALFGRRAVTPRRRLGEGWRACFERECVAEAPAWIRERAEKVRDKYLRAHEHHSTAPFPEVEHCFHCTGGMGSWRQLTNWLYNGDPFSLKFKPPVLPYVEPEFFRPGAGTWGEGKPTW